MADEAARARRYLKAGDPALALGTCEAALADSGDEAALALHMVAARAAQELADLPAALRHLEAAEARCRRGGLDALGSVLTALGDLQLRRGRAGEAGLALDEALAALGADEPLRARAERLREEARAREAEGEPAGAAAPVPVPLAVPLPPLASSDLGAAHESGEPDEVGEDGALDELLGAAGEGAPTAARALAMAGRLLDGAADLDLPHLLDLILAELVQAVGAERGFVLLREPDESLVIRAARDRSGAPVPDPAREISRKIAARAAAEARALRAVRPAEDPRFADSRSAKALDLRAVVAAPLRHRRVALGCVVLDRLGRSEVKVAFDDAAEQLVARFARLASGLIVRTRRREALTHRTEALEALAARGAEQARERLGPEIAAGFVGQSPAAWALLRVLERVAPSDARVLIRGPSGSGKELVAQLIHAASARASAPFLPINCAALPEPLLEAELFGHQRGAFTGAEDDRAGLFERADGGTVLLDEVGEASPRLQAELLRVLEGGEVRRLGASRTRRVDVRVLACTQHDLEAMVAEGRFREDLYYRLHVFEVRVPSLEERREDVPLLARHFAAEARRAHPQGAELDDDALARLAARAWPGNVRQLKNEVTRLVSLGELAERAPSEPAPRAAPAQDPRLALPGTDADEILTLAELERRAIVRALRKSGGARNEAADLLGISRRTLYTRIRAYGLE